MVCLISRSHKKKDESRVVGIRPHHPYPTSLSLLAPCNRAMDFLDAPIFDGLFSLPAPSLPQSTDTLSQLPFIPTTQTPNTSFVRSSYWPSPGSSSPLPAYPSLTNTEQDFPFHRGMRTAQFSFQRPYPYSLSPLPHDCGPAVAYRRYEAVVPYSQHVTPVPIDHPVKKRPPRPANAFLLFRSDFLKRKLISSDQETRQHRLSIIAAKCWHSLSKEEKEKWFLEAERVKERHALQHAGYKFQRRTRTKSRREPKLAPPPPDDFESLCHLADMAYREIINDDLAHEDAKLRSHGLGRSPSTASASVFASPTPFPTPQIDTIELPFLEDCGEQVGQPTFSATANLSVRTAQPLPYMIVPIDKTLDTSTATSHDVRSLHTTPSRALFSYLICSCCRRFVAFHPLVTAFKLPRTTFLKQQCTRFAADAPPFPFRRRRCPRAPSHWPRRIVPVSSRSSTAVLDFPVGFSGPPF